MQNYSARKRSMTTHTTGSGQAWFRSEYGVPKHFSSTGPRSHARYSYSLMTQHDGFHFSFNVHFVPAIFSWRHSSGLLSTFHYLWTRTAGSLAITGVADPLFITFAVVLISTGTLLTGPIRVLIVLNMFTHYSLACTIPPGVVDAEGPQLPKTFLKHLLWASLKRSTDDHAYRALSPLENGFRGDERTGRLNITRAEITKCRKCGQMRPEIVRDKPYVPPNLFLLFLMYLCLSTAFDILLGYQQFLNALGLSFQILWSYHVPVIAYLPTFILSCVLCFAVGTMLIVALWSFMKGETSVEAQDHEIYRKVALSRGEASIDSYNLRKMQNLNMFFHIGEGG
ncbi:hypothetical protein K435DRAFT_845582 [Dendrothele bispora CBS 962.96]|uniref:Uncharacterized protein n=1 Tax=Dendrothele bispora (strain CBS 962.96) TaxID=1314807 RepID=A0A4S8KT59_DENBC|nr:hypothetical protein K435DRAFT_845582 [Dendrothele bispora CBS 962.96]